MTFLNSKVSLNKTTLDANWVLIVVFIFQGWKDASLQILPHSTIFHLNNSLLERKINILNWNLSHSTTYLEVISSKIITFWYGMHMIIGPTKSYDNCNGTQDTIFIKAIMRVFKLTPSSLMYASSYLATHILHSHGNPCCFMNIKQSNSDMTCFPFFVDVIYNQHKNIKTFLRHTQINSGSNCGCFNKGMKHVPFHGFTNHVWDNLIGEMLYAKKHN